LETTVILDFACAFAFYTCQSLCNM
jgi:hypothetical protein